MTISTIRIIAVGPELARRLPRHNLQGMQLVFARVIIMAIDTAVAVGAFAQVMVLAQVEATHFADGFFIVDQRRVDALAVFIAVDARDGRILLWGRGC